MNLAYVVVEESIRNAVGAKRIRRVLNIFGIALSIVMVEGKEKSKPVHTFCGLVHNFMVL